MTDTTPTAPRFSTEPETATAARAEAHRAGATWVAATGAALILAAATVFVAVHWEQIPDLGKFAALVVVTAGAYRMGLRLRRSLPATGTVLVHLGALLVPLDVAAANQRLGLGWRQFLLVDAAVAFAVFATTARVLQSSVLRKGATIAALGIAAGIAANSSLPAPFVVAATALTLVGLRRHELEAAFAASVVALAPLSVYAFDTITIRGNEIIGRGVVRELGILDGGLAWSIVTAIVTTVALAVSARGHDRVSFVAIAAVGLGAHVISANEGVSLSSDARWLSLAAAYLLFELVGLAGRGDPFYGPILTRALLGAECFGGLLSIVGIGYVFDLAEDHRLDSLTNGSSTTLGSAFCALAAGSVVAGVRRWRQASPVGEQRWRDTADVVFDLTAVGALVGAITVITASVERSVIGLVITAIAWVATRRPSSMGAAIVFLGAYALALDLSHPNAVAVSATATMVTLAAGWDRHRRIESLAGAESAPPFGWLVLASLSAAHAWGTGASVAVAVIAAAAMTLVVERQCRSVADAARLAIACTPLVFWHLSTSQVWMPASALLVVVAVEAWRTRGATTLYGGVAPMLLLEFALTSTLGLTLAERGLALMALGFVWTAPVLFVASQWRRPLALGAATTCGFGAALALTTLATAGPALIALGIIGLALSIWLQHAVGQHLGAITATIGCWCALSSNDVTVTEVFLAPVALHLLLTGIVFRSRTPEGEASSWLAYVPGLLLAIGPALLERFADGSSGHALYAGTVAVAAVIVGGWWRQVGPLVVGTATLAVVTVHESLAAGVDVPTWVWLASGGAALLGAAIAMERNDTSPVEAGRRVVDIVQRSFD